MIYWLLVYCTHILYNYAYCYVNHLPCLVKLLSTWLSYKNYRSIKANLPNFNISKVDLHIVDNHLKVDHLKLDCHNMVNLSKVNCHNREITSRLISLKPISLWFLKANLVKVNYPKHDLSKPDLSNVIIIMWVISSKLISFWTLLKLIVNEVL